MQAQHSSELLAHYTSQWRDREVYWTARQRSRSIRDVLCLILDSYDKAKICLPTFPQRRTPKAQVYETIRRFLPVESSRTDRLPDRIPSYHAPSNLEARRSR